MSKKWIICKQTFYYFLGNKKYPGIYTLLFAHVLAGNKGSTRMGRWSKLVPASPLQLTYLSAIVIVYLSQYHICIVLREKRFPTFVLFMYPICIWWHGGGVSKTFQTDTCAGQIFTSPTRESRPGHFKRNVRQGTLNRFHAFLKGIAQILPSFFSTFQGICSCSLDQLVLLQAAVCEDDVHVEGLIMPGRARWTHSFQPYLFWVTPKYLYINLYQFLSCRVLHGGPISSNPISSASSHLQCISIFVTYCPYQYPMLYYII